MIYKAIDVANWFISKFDKESGDVITHLKVQKLLYFAEAWCQVLLGRQLFIENIEAWAHGPVVREVFYEFYGAGSDPLNTTKEIVEFEDYVQDVLLQILETYGDISARKLEHLTHQDRPWKEARGSLPPEARCSNVINKQSIKDYFTEKYREQLDG